MELYILILVFSLGNSFPIKQCEVFNCEECVRQKHCIFGVDFDDVAHCVFPEKVHDLEIIKTVLEAEACLKISEIKQSIETTTPNAIEQGFVVKPDISAEESETLINRDTRVKDNVLPIKTGFDPWESMVMGNEAETSSVSPIATSTAPETWSNEISTAVPKIFPIDATLDPLKGPETKEKANSPFLHISKAGSSTMKYDCPISGYNNETREDKFYRSYCRTLTLAKREKNPYIFAQWILSHRIVPNKAICARLVWMRKNCPNIPARLE